MLTYFNVVIECMLGLIINIINTIITIIITIKNTSIYHYYFYYYFYVEPRPATPHRYRGDADEADKHSGGVETDRESEYSTPGVCQVRGWNDDADDYDVVVEHYD
jgi:hypothetical protein